MYWDSKDQEAPVAALAAVVKVLLNGVAAGVGLGVVVAAGAVVAAGVVVGDGVVAVVGAGVAAGVVVGAEVRIGTALVTGVVRGVRLGWAAMKEADIRRILGSFDAVHSAPAEWKQFFWSLPYYLAQRQWH